jgi:hypothetical protein
LGRVASYDVSPYYYYAPGEEPLPLQKGLEGIQVRRLSHGEATPVSDVLAFDR